MQKRENRKRYIQKLIRLTPEEDVYKRQAVNPDGSFLVSECNVQGVQDKVHFRVLYPADYYTFATPN